MGISRKHMLGIAAVFIAAVAILYTMGRHPICTCGTVKLWEGVVNGPGNSQHLSDWYSFSHIIHGFIFFGIGAWLLRSKPLGVRLIIAAVAEMGWEILENSPLIINRYREATMAFGYSGDSILNSVSDGTMMMIGFGIASRLPWKATVALAIAFELFTLAMIRDNLTLNILMLVSPVNAVRVWQAGG
ncbi:MAG: hypothetical protein RLZZ366_484 [Pseudomonadota bacterium]|jgi:Protein of unknown function (DUF2585)